MDGERQPTYKVLIATLRRMMRTVKECFIVLDALDESKERLELLEVIEGIVQWEEINTHILTTSRTERAIEESMESLTRKQQRVCLQNEMIHDDICAYIRNRLQSDRRLKT